MQTTFAYWFCYLVEIRLPKSGANLSTKSLKTNPRYAALSYTGAIRNHQSPSIWQKIQDFPDCCWAQSLLRTKTIPPYDGVETLWDRCFVHQSVRHGWAELPVALMRSIYEKAACVLMWLGEEADDSNLAMNLLSKFGTIMTMPDDDGVETGKKSGRQTLADVCGEASFNQHWIALRRLFFRPYWSRVWKSRKCC